MLSVSILLSVSLVAMDVLIVNTVLPTILKELGGLAWYAWAIGAYSLGNFVTIPIFSVLVHKIGGRLSFLFAMGIFLSGAVTAAQAPRMEWIVFGRLLMGLGGGGFFALPFGIIALHYPSELQPRAIGLVSAVWGMAAVAGPLLGAAILELAGWRWVFWFNLPAGAVLLGLGLLALQGEGVPRDPAAKLNLSGPLWFAACNAFFLEALARGGSLGIGCGVLAVLSLLGFVYFEKRHASPIIPRQAWRLSHPLGVGFVGMFLASMSFGGTEAYLPLIIQGLWKATPLTAGLILTVGSLSWSWTSVFTHRHAGRPRRLALSGHQFLFLGLIGIFVILYLQGAVYWIYLVWFFAGAGMGLAIPTYNTLALDVGDEFPSGVANGALLLALTWGFAVGPPVAGLAAQVGFRGEFIPHQIGVNGLTPASAAALRLGGLFAVGVSVILSLIAAALARRMPVHRINRG